MNFRKRTYDDSKKRNIVAALMVAMFLAAVEGTVVTTAVPVIVKDLLGFKSISWVFSLYLLTSAVSTPIYGKLSDLYGRKKMLTMGIIIFLVGSCLCGFSKSMTQLVAFRAIQGLGAGSIFTITYTIIGDIFDISVRAKVQGWISTVWGVASLAGPFLGGFLIDTLSWNWIFFINLPFGVVSIIMLQRNFKEKFEKKKHRLDIAGTLLLSSAIILFLNTILSFEAGRKSFLVYFALPMILTLAIIVIFYFVEKKAEEPIIPFDIFTKASILVHVISFLASAVLIGIDVYTPVYIQNVLGYSATVSGLGMAPLSLAWLMTSVILSHAIPRFGMKLIIAVAMMILTVTCAMMLLLGLSSPLFLIIAIVFIMGFGFGGSFTTLTIIVQESTGYNKRGVATATNSLLRTLGQTIGISIFGSLFNYNIVKYFNNIGITGVDPDSLYSSRGSVVQLPLHQVKDSLVFSLHNNFYMMIAAAFICVLLAFAIPKDIHSRR